MCFMLQALSWYEYNLGHKATYWLNCWAWLYYTAHLWLIVTLLPVCILRTGGCPSACMRSLDFPPWVISPWYHLIPFIASNTCRFQNSSYIGLNRPFPIRHPNRSLQTEIWCVRSLGKEPMLWLLSLERKHTHEAFEAYRVTGWPWR